MALSVKICGIQTLDEALMAYNAGASALGFLLGITHKAEDKITPHQAATIIEALKDKDVETVMVTHLLEADAIIAIARQTGVSTIQIHDALSDEGIRTLRQNLPEVKLIKAIHVQGENALETAAHYDAMPELDILLLDSRTADRLGGTGNTHDWSISRKIVEICTKPVWLAGGLGPHNVAQGVEQVGPAGVDVNSGVENTTGGKDPQKVKDFIHHARHKA